MTIIEQSASTHKRPFGKTVKVVAFDCDGVLFDSKEANVRFYNHVLEQVGHEPVRADQREYIHMHTIGESLEYLLGPGSLLEQAFELCKTIDFSAFNQYMETEPGLIEILQFVKARYRVALATNRMVSTRTILSHFAIDHYFDLIVTASDVRFPKPHPESMEKIARTFSAAPEQIVYVGDSVVDEALALATGAFFVSYKNAQLKAQLHISHFDQLQTFLLENHCC